MAVDPADLLYEEPTESYRHQVQLEILNVATFGAIGGGVIYLLTFASPDVFVALVLTFMGLVLVSSRFLSRQRLRVFVNRVEPARRPLSLGRRFVLYPDQIRKARILPSSFSRKFDSIVVTLDTGVEFDLNRPFVSPESTEQLRRFAESLGGITADPSEATEFNRRGAAHLHKQLAWGAFAVWLMSIGALAVFVERGVLPGSSGLYMSLALGGILGLGVASFWLVGR